MDDILHPRPSHQWGLFYFTKNYLYVYCGWNTAQTNGGNMGQTTLSDAVMEEIGKRITAIEERIKQLPWYAWKRKAYEEKMLKDYLEHRHAFRFDDLISMVAPTTFDPDTPEDVILRDLLASPSVFDN